MAEDPPLRVTLLYFPGCPNWKAAEANLRAALNDIDVGNVELRTQVVDAVKDAERLELHGSPTILIDGCDPFAEPGATPALCCRVYRTETGPAGAPTVEQLRQALTAAR